MAELTLLQPNLELLKRQLSSSKHAAKSEQRCQACGGIGAVERFDDESKSRGWDQCECVKSQNRRRKLERIPPEYRLLSLATIRPRPELHEKQDNLIPILQAEPHASYLLSGKNGCGKSLAGWLLYRKAVEDGRPVAAMPVASLLAEYRACERDATRLPSVHPEDLRQRSGETLKDRWFIFLDEFDKARASEFAGEMLFLLMDAIYSYRHQLVVTTNLKTKDLQAHWARSGDTYGPSIMRRVLELDGLIEADMF